MPFNSLYKDIVSDLLDTGFKKDSIIPNNYYCGKLLINVNLYEIILYDNSDNTVKILMRISCYPRDHYNTQRLIPDLDYDMLFEKIEKNKRVQKLKKLSNYN